MAELREEIARIIEPVIFRRWDDLRAISNSAEANRQFGAKRNRAFAKADAILALIAKAQEPAPSDWVLVPREELEALGDDIGMQDVRLVAGEGALRPTDVRDACNIIICRRVERLSDRYPEAIAKATANTPGSGGGGEDQTRSRSQPGYGECSLASAGAEPSAQEVVTPDGGLYPQFSEPLRGHLQFIDAALSYYGGGPASGDVASAWTAITNTLRELTAERDAARRVGAWRPIESAPRDGDTPVLASSSGKVWFQALWDEEDACWVTFNRYLENDFRTMADRKWEPKFWVPLPPPHDGAEPREGGE